MCSAHLHYLHNIIIISDSGLCDTKTRAEIQRAYRQRKLQQEGRTKRPKKTRAELQREFWERMKQKDRIGYEEKERERKRLAYIPTSLLDEASKAKRRKANKDKAQRFRESRKANASAVSDDCGKKSNDSPERVIVKMNFKLPTKRSSSRNRVSRCLANAYKIQSLESEKTSLHRGKHGRWKRKLKKWRCKRPRQRRRRRSRVETRRRPKHQEVRVAPVYVKLGAVKGAFHALSESSFWWLKSW